MGEAGPFDPSTHISSTPSSWITWYFRLFDCEGIFGFLDYQIEGFIWVHFKIIVTIHGWSGKPRHFQLIRTG
jgi:hypothetical protein